MAEVSRITNKLALSGVTTTTTGLYVYGGYQIGKLIPYFRFDKFDFDDDEPYYLPNNTNHIMGGLRYNLNFLSSLKFEYHSNDTALDGTHHSFDIHFAVGF